jgi:hypothetical protein
LMVRIQVATQQRQNGMGFCHWGELFSWCI